MWNPESRKYLLVESGIQETFACRIRNPGNICLWNSESRKKLFVEPGILLFGIWESRKYLLLESGINWIGILNSVPAIQSQHYGIRNPRLSRKSPTWGDHIEFCDGRFKWCMMQTMSMQQAILLCYSLLSER